MTSVPSRISQIVGDRPNDDGPSGFGVSQPHSDERSTPKTANPSPSAISTAPTRSNRVLASGGGSAIRLARSRITATTSTSPTNTHRHEK